MGIEDIKRWQWIVIGLLAGLALGWVWSGSETSIEGRQISQVDFERDVLRKDPNTQQPIIRNISLHPLATDYAGKKVQPVTFDRLMLGAKTGKTYYTPAQFIAMVPYKPLMTLTGRDNPNFTVRDYLAEMAKRDNSLKFSYGWMNERPAVIAKWTVGTVIVVGGIWPTLLNLMVGAGLASKHEKKKKEDYFDRFSHARDASKSAAGPPVTSADRDKLENMNKALEDQLAAAGVLQTQLDPETEAENAEVRKLQGGPLEAVPIAKRPEDDDEIEVKGEFYPVLIHHKKHHEEGGAEGKDSPRPSQSEKK